MGDALRLTLRWVAEAVGGGLRCVDPQREIGNVVIDTRILQPGDLFVAIRGARYDAHHFVAQAFEKGASGAIVEREYAVSPGLVDTDRSDQAPKEHALIEVADTTRALQDLARAVRRASGTN